MKKGFLSIVLAVLAVMLTCSHVVAVDATFPKNIQVVPPKPDIAPDVARLSGMWGDAWETPIWGQGFDAKLAAEKVSDNQAIGTYCWGDNLGLRVTEGCIKFHAEIIWKEGQVGFLFESPNYRRNITFFLKKGATPENDLLEGRDARNIIKMKRIRPR